jgi:hypothetical protein
VNPKEADQQPVALETGSAGESAILKFERELPDPQPGVQASRCWASRKVCWNMSLSATAFWIS